MKPNTHIFSVAISYEHFVQSDNDYWRSTGEAWLIEAHDATEAKLIAHGIFAEEHNPNRRDISWRDPKINVYDPITFPYKLRR